MHDRFDQQPKPDSEAVARIKGWARELFGLPEDASVVFSELRSQEEDYSNVETAITVIGEPGKARKHKVLKPMAEVTRNDLMSLAARGTHG